MWSQRTRHLPALEALEDRQVLSSTLPVNTIAVTQGTVSAPGAIAEVTVPVSARNINGRIPITIGTATSPTAGSALLPEVVSARGPDGRRLPLIQGAPYNPATRPEMVAFLHVRTPGTITIDVTGAQGTTGSFQLRDFLPGDLNGDGQVTLADLQLFSKVYLSQTGDANYNPAADTNLSGQVGIKDAKSLELNLKPLTPLRPIQVKLTLDPRDAVIGHVPSTSGGHTYHKTVTILGRTTPGSIVFADSGLGDYTFIGPAIPTDAHGNFAVKATNSDGINNNDFLVIDPYGQQKIQDFPIYYFPAVYSRDIPKPKTEATSPGTGTTPVIPGGSVSLIPGQILPPGIP